MMNFNIADNQLKIFLEGRIDSNNAAEIEQNIKSIIAENPNCELIFDVDKLTRRTFPNETYTNSGRKKNFLCGKCAKKSFPEYKFGYETS